MNAADRRTARGFDRLSPLWDLMVGLFPGRGISRSRVRHLERAVDRRRALIVGGGTGAFLVALLDSGFAGTVTAIDPSAGMLRRTTARLHRRRPHDGARVDLRHGGLDCLRRDERFDLVCTHFVLDLFDDARLGEVMDRLDAALEDDGLWLCSDFSAPAGGPLRRGAQAVLVGGLYRFFNITCALGTRRLPPIDAGFERLGYRAVARDTLAAGVLWSAALRRRRVQAAWRTAS